VPGAASILFRRIRASFPTSPVILITAYGHTEEAVAAMGEGALYCFTKPVNFPLLLRLVRDDGMT
jgi:DNA-binding NtrC family response regulator